MAHLIDKSALVAEIERRRNYYKRNPLLINAEYCIDEDNAILNFLDTMEVKEAGFGTEVYKYIDEHFNVYDDGNQTLQTKDKKSLIGRIDVENIAKHFFELGIKAAQKGE